MKDSHFSRRDFIKGAGVAGGLLLLERSVSAQTKVIFRRRCRDAGAIVRKNFKNLTAAELTAFKNGVTVMKSRAATDPTSWAYQAAIHGTTASPAQTAWNTCQHNTTHFFSWHRMELCFFERILRKASGLPSLGLPYWNYSESADPNARFLPAAFRTPANATNPLFTTNRNASLNNGTAQLSASAVSLASALPGPVDFYPFSSTVYGTPHSAIHGGIGGWMGSVPTAAQDPIFWLHHCNIDRLWNRWLAGGGGRANPPTSDTVWHNTKFTFFDEFGEQVQMTGAELLNPNVCGCRTCYDEETVFTIWDVLTDLRRFREIQIGLYKKPLVLDTRLLKFELDLNDRAPQVFERALRAVKPEEEMHFKLNFEGVKVEKPVDFFYEVYLNLPDNTPDPNYTMESYAGNLAFFGMDQTHAKQHGEKEELKLNVNITGAVKRLKDLRRQTVSITLVPAGLESREGKRLPIRSNAKISIDQVTLSVDEPDR
ncbi:MAG: tyrosinase family protein [Pyrinomonadaceae bacterium]|nr:tyrosinase family protein [Pyrinomonadaceae bacterium]